MTSIRRYLTLLLVSLLVLITFSAAIQGYRASMQRSAKLFDAELVTLSASLDVLGSDDLQAVIDTHANVALQIWHDTRWALRSKNTSERPIAPFEAGFSEQNFSGQRWRVYVRRGDPQQWYMVAQPLVSRVELAEDMILSAMLPLVISMPFLAVLIYLSVSRGLSPLRALAEQLDNRDVKALDPVRLNNQPAELSPVVDTLNSLFARLARVLSREQQFASNAAHELRTPLSVLKINLHNLRKDAPQQAPLIDKLQHDTDRMIQVVNQLLMLSRTNPDLFAAQLEDVDAQEVAQAVIADLYPQIDQKGQQVELFSVETPLRSNRFLLYTLLQNLIANASKYSPLSATIHVHVSGQDNAVHLCVEDSGPGVPVQKRQDILQRFYRHEQHQQTEGSGLGLAIVQQIVELHHGDILLNTSSLGGLSVHVTLPSQTGAQDAI
ncbi:two-component sensor histidine kinase [Aestuariibacter halophilus]|uniref:histidine kinase n=1 Tax=Fluctibacter halophilus TaxID=226011 RepID=A0ABS8G9I5_9ALTE|nr:ATP-binding protein [Aestuariibacter halophilus]MCC2617088.1 two-component sensor histidine kinase [Aestuariibacter halophilus]